MSVSKRRKLEIWSKTNGLCWYCGGHLDRSRGPHGFTIDHVIPIFAGGKNDLANLVPSCRRCNSIKGKRSLEYLREVLARLEVGVPFFTPVQIAWLEQHDIRIPKISRFPFFFETIEIDAHDENSDDENL